MSVVTPLTYCKTDVCREPITVSDVIKDVAVVESPQHIVVTFKCSKCERIDKMVGTNESWKAFKRDSALEEIAEDNKSQQVVKAAEIEVNAIDSVEDLKTLWRSYKNPPLIEDLIDVCGCDECIKRRNI